MSQGDVNEEKLERIEREALRVISEWYDDPFRSTRTVNSIEIFEAMETNQERGKVCRAMRRFDWLEHDNNASRGQRYELIEDIFLERR